MMEGKSATLLYYWSAKFKDDFEIRQFDERGNEILIKDICPESSLIYNSVTKVHDVKIYSNVFSDFEESHGRVTEISWIPFTKDLSNKVIEKQPHVTIAISEELKQLKQIVPDEYYAACPRKENEIQYIIQDKKDSTVIIPQDVITKNLILVTSRRNQTEPAKEFKFMVNYH